ncbi:hypothetical protein COT29_00175 [Candidatus Micrarchaeota archaeon CG08_land_8_20_14_0_20_59_11]|nr:MAG: hypothetical protein COT29_00175 [Candidatus Micrarchaeota archaeon CG08_land_8_20_14_0_20_59_11]
MKRGQGAFEYVLLLAGVLLIVVLAVVLLRGGIFQSGGKDVAVQNCQRALAQSSVCYDTEGSWVPEGVPTPAPSACTQLNTTYPGTWFGTCGPQPGGAAPTAQTP